MMWDIGGQGISNTMSDRNRSRSPRPHHIRMPSPSFPIPQSNAASGYPFTSSLNSSYPPPPVAVSTSYNSYLYPSISGAAPEQFPSNQAVHVVHHSKHHSSSKNKHNGHHKHSDNDHYKPSDSDHHKHSGHGHPHSHSRPHRVPSPSPMTSFPIPLTSFPAQSPHVHFPTVPHRPIIHSRSSSNALLRAPSRDHLQSQPALAHSTDHTHKSVSKLKKPHNHAALPLNPGPDFQYSKCTGRRRALCIGINYRGQEYELRGCINDAKNVRNFLLKTHYKQSEILLLTDDASDPHMLPTYDNILGAMHWLVRSAKPHDSLFFHYSGHGGQTPDLDGDEADSWDEVIFPLDYKKKGHIVDDLMHDIMVKPLPRGCRLTGLFDACHSGSVLDLQYVYSAHGRLKTSPITRKAQASKASPADVISWSACKDGQTSADTFAGGVAVGAMSHAFIEALSRNPHQTYQELFRSLRLTLNPRYSQKPQLGSSHPIDTNLEFIF